MRTLGRAALLQRDADGEVPASRRFRRVVADGQRQRGGVVIVRRRGDLRAVVHRLVVVAWSGLSSGFVSAGIMLYVLV